MRSASGFRPLREHRSGNTISPEAVTHRAAGRDPMKPTRAFLVMAALTLAITVSVLAAGSEHVRAGASLVKGWNNVSYSGGSLAPSEALASIEGKYDAVYRWNAATQTYEVYSPVGPAFGNTLSNIADGDAVWISVTAASATLASTTKTGNVSIAASTFLPTNDLAIYEKSFNQLNPVGTDAASERYYAPVVLPDGATITSMTVAFEAGSGASVQARLDFTPMANGTNAAQIFKLAEVLSSAGASPQTANAFSHTVDNEVNVYFVVVDLIGGAGAKLRGISIAYTGG